MTETAPRIFIGVPAYGGWTRNACTQSLVRVAVALSSAGVKIGGKICNLQPIHDVRNMFGSLMVEQDFTHLLFVDYDMAFGQETVFKLIRANKPIIGANCARRKLPIESSVWSDTPPTEPLGTVLGVSMALTLIETRVFRQLAKRVPSREAPPHFRNQGLKGPLYSFFDHIYRDGGETSEDLSFCTRWRELCDGEVWVLTGEHVGHIGDYTYALPREAKQFSRSR
jgi:hypothetical protein